MVTITSDMPIKYFDTLAYVRAAKKIKDPEKLSAYQVKQMEAALETVASRSAFDRRGLATKKDIRALEKDIDGIKERLDTFATKEDLAAFSTKFATKEDLKDLRYDTLKFVVWTGATVFSLLSGMLAKGFHWF